LGRDKRIGVRFGHTFFCQFDQLDEEKLKYDSLAQHQGFGPAFWGQLPEADRRHSKDASQECNKYDLTTTPYF